MKTPNLGVAAALGTACMASCTAPTRSMTAYMSSSSTQNETSLSNQVFSGVNHYRHDRNKQDLIRHPGLAVLARDHAQYLRLNRGKNGARGNDANHHGFGNRAMKAQSFMGFQRVAENVVSCKGGSGETYVRLWSRSASHEKTMRAAYQYTGIGTVVDGDGMVFSVQLFGTKDRPALVTGPTFGTF